MRRGGGRIRRGRRGSIGRGVGGRGDIGRGGVVGEGGRGIVGMGRIRMENVVMVETVILVVAGVEVQRGAQGHTRVPGVEAGHGAGAGVPVEVQLKLALEIRVRNERSTYLTRNNFKLILMLVITNR